MPKLVHQETMCCGYKRCPVIEVFDDGSVTLSDDDADLGSVGVIKIRPEAANRLLELLSSRKK
jgi:hypothetical protein